MQTQPVSWRNEIPPQLVTPQTLVNYGCGAKGNRDEGEVDAHRLTLGFCLTHAVAP